MKNEPKNKSRAEALKHAMTGKTRTRATKKTRNLENLRPQGSKTSDIIRKLA